MKTLTLPILNLYEFSCDPNLADRFNKDIFSRDIEWSQIGGDNPIEYGSDYGNLKTEKYFFNEEWFDWAHRCLQEVSEIHLNSKELKITEYWMTRARFGERSTDHRHNFSIFSGLYYLTDQEKSYTRFSHPYNVTDQFEFLIEKISTLSKPELKIFPKKGKLIIFPSFLYHQLVMKDKNIRYTLSFNSFLNGTISAGSTKHFKLNVENL